MSCHDIAETIYAIWDIVYVNANPLCVFCVNEVFKVLKMIPDAIYGDTQFPQKEGLVQKMHIVSS